MKAARYQRGMIGAGLRAKGVRVLVVMAVFGLAGAVVLGGGRGTEDQQGVQTELAPDKSPPVLEMRFRTEAVASLSDRPASSDALG